MQFSPSDNVTCLIYRLTEIVSLAPAPQTEGVSEGVFDCAVEPHSSGQRHFLPEDPSPKFLRLLLVPFDVVDLEDSRCASMPDMFDLEESAAGRLFRGPQCIADFRHNPDLETEKLSVEFCGAF